MFQFKFCLILLFFLVIISKPGFSSELPVSVQQKLKQGEIPASAVGVFVSDINSAQALISFNAEKAMNPASVMKLVTTFAGLELLGPAYSWPTILYANGEVENGVLNGDLVIKGYGDPKLDLENFWLLIHRLRQSGLYKITGNLILDHTHYDIPEEDPGAFDGQPFRTYNIPPEALLVNYRTSTLHLTPQPENNAVRVIVDPFPESLQIYNNLKLTNGVCGDWRNLLGIEVRAGSDNDHRMSVLLNGSFSINCGKVAYLLGLHDSSTYTRDLFKRLWAQQGGIFQGNVVNGEAPEGLTPIKIYQSPPLAEIIRGINKFSNNIAARQLYLTIGTTTDKGQKRSPVTLEKSEMAIKQWLASKQMNFPELMIENGSGLSRKERISAEHMGELLLAAFRSPVMPEFISSLPIAAIDGTMKNRLNGTPVSGLAHMKTGSLKAVRALAGYMLDKFGKRIVVVFFVNHDKAMHASSAMDALLHWVYNREN